MKSHANSAKREPGRKAAQPIVRSRAVNVVFSRHMYALLLVQLTGRFIPENAMTTAVFSGQPRNPLTFTRTRVTLARNTSLDVRRRGLGNEPNDLEQTGREGWAELAWYCRFSEDPMG